MTSTNQDQQLSIEDIFEDGKALHLAGNTNQAQKRYQAILERDPIHAEALHHLGIIQHQSGDNLAATRLIIQAIEIDPKLYKAQFNLGVVYEASGDLEKASNEYRLVIKRVPTHVGALINLGNVLQKLGSDSDAVEQYRQASVIEPDNAIPHNNLGKLLYETGSFELAEQSFRRALALKNDFTDAGINLGNSLREQDKYGDAEQQFRQVLDAEPESSTGLNALGNILRDTGRFSEAEKCYRRAIELKPNYANAYRNLTAVCTLDNSDPVIDEMARLFDEKNTSDDQRMRLGFGLAKIHDENAKYEDAFRYLMEANRLVHADQDFDLAQETARFDLIKETYNHDMFASAATSVNKDNTPIFITGMPRSGSTLVEQILASHTDVTGAGEVLHLDRVIDEYWSDPGSSHPHGLSAMPQQTLEALAAQYLTYLKRQAPIATRITDKSLTNFKHIGLIKMVMPNACIVHVHRDPMDTCFSIFSKLFTGSHTYAYDMTTLGQYYRLYQSMIQHWEEVLPGGLFTISYEDLVNDLETETRRLLDHCNLPFEPACLSFHETERPIRTASAEQVRRPLYSSSIGRWRDYQNDLEPLVQALAPK